MIVLVAGGLLLVSLASVVFYNQSIGQMTDDHKNIIRNVGHLLYGSYQSGMTAEEFSQLRQRIIENAGERKTIIFFRVINADDKKIAASKNREEIGTVLEFIPAPPLKEPAIRSMRWDGEGILELSFQSNPKEVLTLGVSLKQTRDSVFRLAVGEALVVFLVTVTVGLLLYSLFRRLFLSPLNALQRGMQRARQGNLDIVLPTAIAAEIGDLAQSFNGMLLDLRHTQANLQETNTVLEIKVNARTRELRELANRLEAKAQERTEELQSRVKELEKFRRFIVGRELKMMELKKELKRLQQSQENNGSN